jgi:FAD/FMN-containing dehydrogenase
VLKLFPRPRETTVAFAGLPTLAAVRELFERMRAAAGPMLTAFEMMPERAMEFLTRHAADVRDPLQQRHPWYVLVELSGHQGNGETRMLAERLLGAAIEDATVADVAIAESIQQARALWHLRESLPDTQRHEGGSIKHDVSVPVARLPELVERGNAIIEAMMPGARPLPFGHFGDGNLHYNVSQPLGMAKDRFLAEWAPVNARIHALVLELGGSISAEHGVGRLKREEIARIKSPVEMSLMHALKAALDPQGILNPGKVL